MFFIWRSQGNQYTFLKLFVTCFQIRKNNFKLSIALSNPSEETILHNFLQDLTVLDVTMGGPIGFKFRFSQKELNSFIFRTYLQRLQHRYCGSLMHCTYFFLVIVWKSFDFLNSSRKNYPLQKMKSLMSSLKNSIYETQPGKSYLNKDFPLKKSTPKNPLIQKLHLGKNIKVLS